MLSRVCACGGDGDGATMSVASTAAASTAAAASVDYCMRACTLKHYMYV